MHLFIPKYVIWTKPQFFTVGHCDGHCGAADSKASVCKKCSKYYIAPDIRVSAKHTASGAFPLLGLEGKKAVLLDEWRFTGWALRGHTRKKPCVVKVQRPKNVGTGIEAPPFARADLSC